MILPRFLAIFPRYWQVSQNRRNIFLHCVGPVLCAMSKLIFCSLVYASNIFISYHKLVPTTILTILNNKHAATHSPDVCSRNSVLDFSLAQNHIFIPHSNCTAKVILDLFCPGSYYSDDSTNSTTNEVVLNLLCLFSQIGVVTLHEANIFLL